MKPGLQTLPIILAWACGSILLLTACAPEPATTTSPVRPLCMVEGSVTGLTDIESVRIQFSERPSSSHPWDLRSSTWTLGPSRHFLVGLEPGRYHMSLLVDDTEFPLPGLDLKDDQVLGEIRFQRHPPVTIQLVHAAVSREDWSDARLTMRSLLRVLPSGEVWEPADGLPPPELGEIGTLHWPTHPTGTYEARVEVPGCTPVVIQYRVTPRLATDPLIIRDVLHTVSHTLPR